MDARTCADGVGAKEWVEIVGWGEGNRGHKQMAQVVEMGGKKGRWA